MNAITLNVIVLVMVAAVFVAVMGCLDLRGRNAPTVESTPLPEGVTLKDITREYDRRWGRLWSSVDRHMYHVWSRMYNSDGDDESLWDCLPRSVRRDMAEEIAGIPFRKNYTPTLAEVKAGYERMRDKA